MCLNKKKIVKKDGRIVYANCGHCPACEQVKANKVAARIEANKIHDGKHISLFLTLTYSNDFVPYIYREDIYQVVINQQMSDRYTNVIPVYRDNSVRRVRVVGFPHLFKSSSDNVFASIVKRAYFPYMYADTMKANKQMIDVLQLPFDFTHSFDSEQLEKEIFKLPAFRVREGKNLVPNKDEKIAVCLNSDIQKFWKRLDINLKRKYNYYGQYSRFSTAEYGENTFRPHFHASLQIEADALAIFQKAIVDSWKYSSVDRLQRGIEIEKHASSYVASYLCKSENLPLLFKKPPFAAKHSFSRLAGSNNPDLSFASLIDKIEKRDLSYNKRVKQGNSYVYRRCLLPTYIISRYFPKFKGFNKLSTEQLGRIYSSPESTLLQFARFLDYDSRSISFDKFGNRYSHGWKERFSVSNMLDNVFLRHEFIMNEEFAHKSHDLKLNLSKIRCAQNRCDINILLHCHPDDPITLDKWFLARDIYALYASQVWTIYASNVIKYSFTGELGEELKRPQDRYINYYEFLDNPKLSLNLHEFIGDSQMEIDKQLYNDLNSSAFDKKLEIQLTDKRTEYLQKKHVNSLIYHSKN